MKRIKFTLIEMVIVVGILLFLTAGLFALGNVLFKKYYIMQGKMEMLKIQNAIAAYKNATGNFPPDYRSSSHNEDASGSGVGGWAYPVYMNQQWEGYQQAKDIYDKFSPPEGCPKALVEYMGPSGWPNWGVWYWSWGSDIGGTLPKTETGTKGGYTCQHTRTIADNIGAIQGTFGTKFPSKVDPNTNLPLMVSFIKIKEAQAINVRVCDDPIFECGKSDPNDSKWSCGWHNFNADTWEGAYNGEEMSKALYDYLCRPMKGRMKEGVPVNPKFADAKPFIEVSNKLIRPTGKPPTLQPCTGEPMMDNPTNYKRYGDGLYNMTDAFEIIDVWGTPYFYVSSAKEYLTPSNNNSIKPYQSYWLADSALGVNESFGFDIFPPFYNPGSYDLGSKGPDKQSVNWIPMDYKLESPSGYHKISIDDDKSYYIFGQPGETGYQNYFLVLPSDALKLTDFDNDNINNFSENAN